ncbi:MAG TPA: helix-turn-helix transcriptional regulator [Actinokineospora sp.]|jgi:hypothetical protein|nr:helix-turn-helix transcriptional regulator [Actinokineospora sp.]
MGIFNGAGGRELGDLLRVHRVAAGLSLKQLGARVGRSPAHLHRLEVGERAVTTETEVVHYLASCGAPFQDVQRLVRFCREMDDTRGYWLPTHGRWMGDSLRSLIFHESSAVSSVNYEPELVPGLLQTEAYARARFLCHADQADDVEPGVKARTERQRILFRRTPAKFTFLVQERALRLIVGDHQLMTEQMLAMLFLADQPNIKIRVVPGTEAFGGSFHYFGFERRNPSLVYLDNHVGGLFLQDKGLVESYVTVLRSVAKVAMNAEESRMLIADLAGDYDRVSDCLNDSGQVAQEQL